MERVCVHLQLEHQYAPHPSDERVLVRMRRVSTFSPGPDDHARDAGANAHAPDPSQPPAASSPRGEDGPAPRRRRTRGHGLVRRAGGKRPLDRSVSQQTSHYAPLPAGHYALEFARSPRALDDWGSGHDPTAAYAVAASVGFHLAGAAARPVFYDVRPASPVPRPSWDGVRRSWGRARPSQGAEGGRASGSAERERVSRSPGPEHPSPSAERERLSPTSHRSLSPSETTRSLTHSRSSESLDLGILSMSPPPLDFGL